MIIRNEKSDFDPLRQKTARPAGLERAALENVLTETVLAVHDHRTARTNRSIHTIRNRNGNNNGPTKPRVRVTALP